MANKKGRDRPAMEQAMFRPKNALLSSVLQRFLLAIRLVIAMV